MSDMDRIAVTQFGSALSLVTGGLLGLGFALLQDDPLSKTMKKATGGAIFLFGMYLVSPVALRKAWL